MLKQSTRVSENNVAGAQLQIKRVHDQFSLGAPIPASGALSARMPVRPSLALPFGFFIVPFLVALAAEHRGRVSIMDAGPRG